MSNSLQAFAHDLKIFYVEHMWKGKLFARIYFSVSFLWSFYVFLDISHFYLLDEIFIQSHSRLNNLATLNPFNTILLFIFLNCNASYFSHIWTNQSASFHAHSLIHPFDKWLSIINQYRILIIRKVGRCLPYQRGGCVLNPFQRYYKKLSRDEPLLSNHVHISKIFYVT